MTAVTRLHSTDARRAVPQLPGKLGRLCRSADITDDHIVGIAVWFVVGLALATMVGIAGAGRFGLLVLGAVFVVPAGFLVQRLGRRAQRLVSSLPAMVDLIARSLRSGASFTQALSEASDQKGSLASEELRDILDEVSRGVSVSAVLRTWAERAGHPEMRIVASALALASENETGSTRALEGVSQSLRDRRALNAEITALTAQASSSLRAMVLLPVGFMVLDAVSTRTVVRFLVDEPFGRLCLAAGLALEVVGWLWMRALVQRQLP